MTVVRREGKAINERYRPLRFSEIIGNDGTKAALAKWMAAGNDRARVLLLHGASSGGKAQPLTSGVLTPSGYVRMGDVQVGDVVLDGGGRPCSVLGVFPQGRRPIYRITFNDRTAIEVADNHLNSVFSKAKGNRRVDQVVETLKLKEMVERKGSRFWVDIPVVDCWADEDITIDPYLLGALIGDGSLTAYEKYSNFQFCNSEPDIVDKVDRLLRQGWGMRLRKRKGDNYEYDIAYEENSDSKYTFLYKGKTYPNLQSISEALALEGYRRFDGETILRIANGNAVNTLKHHPELAGAIQVSVNPQYKVWTNGNALKKELKRFGLMCKSTEKHIPVQYLHASVKTRLSLLQGLFDTDGYVGVNEKCSHFWYATSSPRLAVDFEFLVRSLGLQCTVSVKKSSYKKDGKKVECADSYEFYLHPSNAIKIFTSQKHSGKYNDKRHPPRKKILSVEYIRDDECQCLYVSSPLHTYITDAFTVTHNTTTARILAMGLNCERGDTVEPCLECESCRAALAGNAMHIVELNMAELNTKEAVDEIVGTMDGGCLTGRNRVYIFDEVQMLTQASQNLLLKAVEKPPRGVYIFLCTTDPGRLIQPLRNRCSQYAYTLPSDKDISELLRTVTAAEGIELTPDQKRSFFELARGRTYREILFALEQVAAGAELGEGAFAGDNAKAMLFEMAKAVLYKGDFAAFLRLATNGANYEWEGWRCQLRTMAGNEIAKAGLGNLQRAALYYDILDYIEAKRFLDANPFPNAVALAWRICAEILGNGGK